MKCLGQDTDFPYVCIVTLIMKIWPWVNVMTRLWIMDNCVYPNPTNSNEYGPEKYHSYVCNVTFDIRDMTFVEVMTHPRVMDNNCVK